MFASKEEEWFNEYVQELVAEGYIEYFTYQPDSIELAPEASVHARTATKSGRVDESIVLAKKVSYTPDWKIYWSNKAFGMFFWEQDGVYPKHFYPYRKANHDAFIPFYAENNVSVIDVKGEFIGRSNTSAITFPILQKWLLSKGIYVQKVVVSLGEKGLFNRTFTPVKIIHDEVYKNDYKKNGNIVAKAGESKLKYKPIILEQYVNRK